jgi:hypothetical protein
MAPKISFTNPRVPNTAPSAKYRTRTRKRAWSDDLALRTIQLIKAYTDLDRRLLEAAADKDYATMKDLVDKGADVNVRSAEFKTPLHDLVMWRPDAGDIARLEEHDFIDLPSLILRLRQPSDAISLYLWRQFSDFTRNALQAAPSSGSNANHLSLLLRLEFNKIVLRPDFYDPERFAGIVLRPQTQFLLLKIPRITDSIPRRHVNRLLLEDAYPKELSRNQVPEAISLLLQNGADIDAVDQNHGTPLYYAAVNMGLDFSYSAVVLLIHGANASIQDNEGATPCVLSPNEMGDAMTCLRPNEEPDCGAFGPASACESSVRIEILKTVETTE